MLINTLILRYIVDRPLPMGKNKKVLCKFKDELRGRIMTEFVGVRPNTYSFLIDDFEEKKKREAHTVYTEEVNKITLRNGDKRV